MPLAWQAASEVQWVCTTALENPVDPDVKNRIASSSALGAWALKSKDIEAAADSCNSENK